MKLRCDTMKYLYLHEKLLVESVADLIPQIKGGGGLTSRQMCAVRRVEWSTHQSFRNQTIDRETDNFHVRSH